MNIRPLSTLTRAARYLGLGLDYLKYTLSVRVVKYPGHTIDVNNEAREAKRIKTTLMKTIYSRLFETICERINTTLSNASDKQEKLLKIGILDAFGFENNQTNSLE